MSAGADCVVNSSSEPAQPETLSWDPASAFAALATFGGDYERTAAALRISFSELTNHAKRHKWDVQLTNLGVLSKRGAAAAPTEIEKLAAHQRAANRSAGLVLGLRARQVVDSLLTELMSSPEALADATKQYNKFGTTRTYKGIKDLVEAANAAQRMTQAALQDDPDHAERDAQILRDAGQQLASDLDAALTAATTVGKTSSQLVREALAAAPSPDPILP